MPPFPVQGTFVAPASFNPPVLPPLNATSAAMVMLDKVLYIGGDRKNGTFAQAITRTGQALGVSLWITDPPSPSHLCLHLSGLKVTQLVDEPLVVCLGNGIAIIRVAYNLYARPIESAHDMGVSDCDYLVYRAHTEAPSLDVLPNPKPHIFQHHEIGFYPCGDGGGEEFYMAVLRPRFVHLQYDLHVFSSRTNAWTTRPALLEPPWPGFTDDYLVHENERVITLEGGLLGWVDLWRGILLCSVLDADPVVRYIQFPKPMDGNVCQYPDDPARAFRDVTFSDGFIKLIEMEYRMRLVHTAGTATLDSAGLGMGNSMGACTTACYTTDGWSTVTWNRKLSSDSDRWRQDCTACASTSSILPQLTRNQSEILALENLDIAGPLWSMHDEDVVYLMAKEDSKDIYALAIGFNIRNSTVDGVTLFPEERCVVLSLAYQPFALSKFLNMASENDVLVYKHGWELAAPICWIEEREDSKNDPDNTMILVAGLDPCVTVNQLKGIFAMYGELCYLKIHADEQYGLVKFVNRLCAEQAISALNGAKIGGQSVLVSWRPSNLNKQKQPPRWRMSERNRVSYHPYACSYGSS